VLLPGRVSLVISSARVRVLSALLASIALALLLAAWVVATPPFGGPDEASHYLRTLSLANGTLVGPRVPFRNPTNTPQQQAWTDRDSRGVSVPARMSPGNEVCLNGKPDVGATCTEASYTGDYHPLPYLLPALALKVSGDVSTGQWLARGASAAAAGVFLILAFALAQSGGGWSLLGLLIAITPMVLFVSSVLNPNGLEISANLALLAGLMALSRDPAAMSRWRLAAIALSAVVVVLSWQLGPVFVAVDLALTLMLMPRAQLATLVSSRRREVIVCGGILGASFAVYLIYASAAGLLHSGLRLHPVWWSLQHGLDQLNPVVHDGVGVFGALTVRLPAPVYWIWWIVTLALCISALVLTDRRGRVAITITALTVFAFPVLFWAFIYRQSGFGLQGRYMLPVLTIAPLLAGELIGRTGATIGGVVGRSLIGGTVGLLVALQLVAWWVSARVAAGRAGSIWFQSQTSWRPPFGWWLWTGCAVAGAAALSIAAIIESGSNSRRGWSPGVGASIGSLLNR
jgi:hypothetical protein